jgi:hypothetical protein
VWFTLSGNNKITDGDVTNILMWLVRLLLHPLNV